MNKKYNEIEVLEKTIEWFESQLQPHDCGWMHTTIDGLKHRIQFINNELNEHLPNQSWAEGYRKWKKNHCPHN